MLADFEGGVWLNEKAVKHARGPATAMDVVKVPPGGYTIPEAPPARAKERA